MFKDDDEEEENTFGVTRYPCMPSLVALQQMRNRLHLAFLGRKLMKWTALATGREMRRLASELYDVYQGFGEDMRNAFILLARGRYFVPQLNSIVTEDINTKAGVVVQQSSKAVSGVKIVQFEIFETEYPPYPHLGIEKGGQAILEAKKAWLELLKRLIMMMQLRASFLMVELANKNATKKWNVLSKLVVPRLNLSCHYILSELEEIEREDNFRLKRFKELKVKKAKGKEESIIIESIIENETCECTLSLETKELVDEFLYNDQEETEPYTEFEELESNITEYQFEDTVVDKERCIICKGFEQSFTDKEENKTCPNCKNKVKQDKINNYEENNCPNCKNNEMPKGKSKELLKVEQILNDDNLCPSCKKKKSIEFIDQRNMVCQTELLSLPNNECPNCKKRKSNEFIDQREVLSQTEMSSKIDNVCPNCKRSIEIPKRIDLKNKDSDVKSKKINKQDSTNNKYIDSDLERAKQNLCPRCKKENIKKSHTELDPRRVSLQLGISKSLNNNNTDSKIKNMCPFCKNNNLKFSRSTDFDQNKCLQLTGYSKTKFDPMSKEKHVCPSCKNTNTKKDQNIAYKAISTTVSQNSTEFGGKTIDKNICPSCIACDIKQDKNTKSDIDNNKYNMKNKMDNKVCPACNFENYDTKYLNKTNKKEIKERKNEDYAHDQRGIEEKESTKYCPACKTPAMKNYNTCDCGNTSDVQISESDGYDEAPSETCSLCEKMRLSKTNRSSCSFKSNVTNKQVHQTCTDNISETVETINEIVKFKRLPDTDDIIREEITIKTRRTQKYVLPSSSETDKYIKKPIEKPEKPIKLTKSENINQGKMNGILKVSSSISSVPTKVSCLSSCSIPISEKHSKSNSGEALHIMSQSVLVSSQNLNPSQCNKTCMKNRYTESESKSTKNCMICQNTKTESNVSLTKSRKTNKCSKDMTKVKSDNNSCCKIKIISKDRNSKENSDEEEIELTPSTIVILKKILSYTSKSAASCYRSIETDQKQSEKSNVGSKAKVFSDINSVKSEPCMQIKIKESFDKKLRKMEPICNTCDSKDVCVSHEDIPKKDRILPCFSRSSNDLKPEKPKLDPSIKPKQPANIESYPETYDKISSCKQENQETTEQKTKNMKIDNNSCHECDKTKESKVNSSEIKEKEQTSKYVCNKTTTCENKSCQTRQQHHSRELKEKSKSNKSIKTNSKCLHAESCCTCKKKLEDEVQKTCTCSKAKPISHTVNEICTCMKAKLKASKIVIKLSGGNCSCNKQTSDSVHISSSKQSNHSDSCTGSVETMSIANQTCLMDRLSDDVSEKSGCLCLKNSNLKDMTRETEKKLSCSKSKIAMQKDDSETCTCKKNTSANGNSVVAKKCSDIKKSVSRECSCVSDKDTKKVKAEHLCACHQANIYKSKETEIKNECQCQKHAHSKTSICSCQQLKPCNSDNKKEKPKFSCECSFKQSKHRTDNKDTVSSGNQTCPKCLSTDQDLNLTNVVCSCTKHKPNHKECSCSSTKTALSNAENLSKTCSCQAVKTSPSSYKQEYCKTSDVKKIHSCTCKKPSELKQPCTCSQAKSDTSKDHSQSSRINSKTCKDAQPQSKKSNKDHSRECSCRSSKNKIESDSEKSFDSFQSLVKTPCSCRKHNTRKTNEKHHDVTNKTEETPPRSCHAADKKSGSYTKHQPHISKTETDTQCSCSPSENSFKPNVSFETEIGKESLTGSNKSQCSCKSKQNKENSKKTCQICKKEISEPCSCKETKPKMTKTCTNVMAASPKCPCESSKKSASIASTQSTESISVGSQTCSRCASIQTSQKSIRFSYDASPTRTIKSDSTLPTESSSSLKSCLSSQSQSSLCSCAKKDVSTSTKRSDRYDVRTLRDLPVEPKKLDCPCQSDSAVLKMKKPRNIHPVGKCCSLHDSHYFRY